MKKNFGMSDLIEIWRSTLEFPSHDQNRLEGPQTKIVVVLLGQLFLGQFIQHCHLLGQHLQVTTTTTHQPAVSHNSTGCSLYLFLLTWCVKHLHTQKQHQNPINPLQSTVFALHTGCVSSCLFTGTILTSKQQSLTIIIAVISIVPCQISQTRVSTQQIWPTALLHA